MKGWKKCPSVTPGGKPFFYHNAELRLSAVWSRYGKAWIVASQTLAPIEVDGKHYWKTPTAAMKAAERIA